MGLLWVGKGAKALVGVEPGGIGRYRVECGVRRVRWVDCSVLEQSNLTKPLFDVVFIWTFANSVGVCGVGAVLGTAVRSAWRVWLLNHWRGAPSGSACWRATGGGRDSPECLKKENFRKFELFVGNWQDCGYQSWRGVRGTPRRVRPPNFGANGPLVGPGDLQ